MASNDIEEGKVCAILAYIVFIVGLIWFFADEKMRKNKFAAYHVKQAIVLAITAVIIGILASVIVSIFAFIPIFGWFLIGPLIWILWLAILVLAIIGLINAVQGQMKPLPIIGQFGEKFNF